MKFFRNKENKTRRIKIIEEALIRIDIFIEGMEPVKGVPIEIIGRKSYELLLKGETEKENKKKKYQFAIIVDIFQEGISKIVSFESQVIMTNQTDYDICIAHVLLTDTNRNEEELTDEEIKNSLKEYEELDLVDPNFKHLINFKELELFDTVNVGEEFRIPLKWFLMDVSIFYKIDIDDFTIFNILIPDIKNTFLKKGRQNSTFSRIQKYNFLSKEKDEIRMFAVDVQVNKPGRAVVNRPCQFD